MIDVTTAEHYDWGEGCEGWRLVRTEALSVIEERMPPGSAEVPHFHRAARQFFYVLAGAARFELGQEQHLLAARQGIEVPPGAPHRILSLGPAALEMLVISQPRSQGDRELVAPLQGVPASDAAGGSGGAGAAGGAGG